MPLRARRVLEWKLLRPRLQIGNLLAMNISGNTILITGGGTGIGRGLAEALHARGNKVIIAGRRKNVLDEVVAANPGMAAYAFDANDAAGVKKFAETVTREHPKLNVLMNNAGIMKPENLLANPGTAVAEETIATNFIGPIRLTLALLPHLMKQPKATIINVTSGLATVPLVYTPTYSVTKAAIHSYTDSLRYQLRKTSVEVKELTPPWVATELMPGQSKDSRAMPLKDSSRR